MTNIKRETDFDIEKDAGFCIIEAILELVTMGIWLSVSIGRSIVISVDWREQQWSVTNLDDVGTRDEVYIRKASHWEELASGDECCSSNQTEEGSDLHWRRRL